jgi:hypothetical protein
MIDDSENKPYANRYFPTPLFEPSSRLCSPQARSVLFAATFTTCANTVVSTNSVKPTLLAALMYCRYTSFLTRPCSLCSFVAPASPDEDVRVEGEGKRTALLKLCLRCSFSFTSSRFLDVSSRESTAVPLDGVELSFRRKGVAIPEEVAVSEP